MIPALNEFHFGFFVAFLFLSLKKKRIKKAKQGTCSYILFIRRCIINQPKPTATRLYGIDVNRIIEPRQKKG